MTPVSDRRASAVVGRHARLELVFTAAGGMSRLAHGYAEPPLRVGRALPDGSSVQVILASSAPGMFGGDSFEQRVVLERGASVRLRSQSALQVHPAADGGTARIKTLLDVADGAELQCVWDPLIPFARSRFEQQIELRLCPAARVLWSDAFMAGREGKGERWRFLDLRHRLRVTRGGSTEYLERYRIRPEQDMVDLPWVAGRCCYFGTAFASGWDVHPEVAERLHLDLNAIDGVIAAVDRLGPRFALVRLAASAGPQFHAARRLVLDSCSAWT